MAKGPASATISGALLGGVYRVGALLGEGAMGAVYEATQETLGRKVAIKVLTTRGGGLTPADLERFGREARSAAALGHPNIVQVTDFRADTDPPFLVMERLVGESLRATISREKRLPVSRVALIGTQILDALEAAHRAGIVHRDIKPDNVFLTKMAGVADLVKVVDFGVAKLLDDRSITAHGALVGSPAYMAPEQAMGLPVDHRADLWAVGATLYHALAGRLPFDAKSLDELLTWLAERPPTPLASLVPDLDPRMAATIARALTKDPARRFASATEMQAALAPLLPVLSTTTERSRPPMASTPTIAASRTSPIASTVSAGGDAIGHAPTVPFHAPFAHSRTLLANPHPYPLGASSAPMPAALEGESGQVPGPSRGSSASIPAFTERPAAGGRAWVGLLVGLGIFGIALIGAVAVLIAFLFVHTPDEGPGPAASTTSADARHPVPASPSSDVLLRASPNAPPPTAPAPGPTAPHLPPAWATKETSIAGCVALRIAPFKSGKVGSFQALSLKYAEGLGSQLGATFNTCASRCEGSQWERYLVRVSFDGAVTEARVPGDVSACPARDDCLDEQMRENASIEAPPDEQESVVELICTFD